MSTQSFNEARPAGREAIDEQYLLNLRANGPPLPRQAQQYVFDDIVRCIDRASKTDITRAVENARGTKKLAHDVWRQLLRYGYYLVQADCASIADMESTTREVRDGLGQAYVEKRPTATDMGLVCKDDQWIDDGADAEEIKNEILALVDACVKARTGLRNAEMRFVMARREAERVVGIKEEMLEDVEREIVKREVEGKREVKQEESDGEGEVRIKKEEEE